MIFFSLIICTYNRTESLNRLLCSIADQTLIPNQIIIVDSSEESIHSDLTLNNLNVEYYHVSIDFRGLTRQRNYGITKVDKKSKVISFLDDDLVLERYYFHQIIKVFDINENVIGVGGYITNEVKWKKNERRTNRITYNEFHFDGYFRKLPLRFALRKVFGLLPNVPPGFMPSFSHGYSTSFLPPTGMTYKVELLMGGVSAYRRSLFNEICFSEYFKGYGLYEDADFSIRASRIGSLYVNTRAIVKHLHDPNGRPNHFKYGKMVTRNGHYVWRVKNPKPNLIDQLKWYLISIMLILIRLLNVFKCKNICGVLSESLGRVWGLLSLNSNVIK